METDIKKDPAKTALFVVRVINALSMLLVLATLISVGFTLKVIHTSIQLEREDQATLKIIMEKKDHHIAVSEENNRMLHEVLEELQTKEGAKK
jgi:DNA-binding transcriptional MerR regulator